MAETYGVGLGYKWDERLILGLDFTYQPWSKADYLPLIKREYTKDILKGNFNDRYRVSFGAEYKNAVYSTKYFDRMRFRAGAYYEKSYMKIQGSDLNEMGATVGLGLPILKDKSIINLSAQYYHRKLSTNNKLVENGLLISVGISFNEFWFFKRKIE